MLRCRPHPQSGTVTADPSACEIELWYFSHAGLLHWSSKIPRRYYPRPDTWEVLTMEVTNSHSPYCHVLELLYTDNLWYEVEQL